MKIKPTLKQHKALQILLNKNGMKYLLFGGSAGGGKSVTGCMWLIIMCLQYPETKYFIGRDTLKSLRSSTIQSFLKTLNVVGLDKNIIKINGQDNFIEFTNGSRIDLLACTYLPSDPFYERFGSFEYTSGWLEEAGEIDFEAFDTLKSRIGRHLNDKYDIESKILITCNPKKNWLYRDFYKPWVQGVNKDFEFIQSKVADNTFIEINYIDNLNNIKNQVKKQRLLYGVWDYDNSDNLLVEYEKVDEIFKNQIQEGENYITCDVARFGKDRSVIMVWSGFKVVAIKVFDSLDLLSLSDEIQKIAISFGINRNNILVDENGVGSGVIDMVKCKGFISNSRPLNNENFDMLKSQCAFRLSEMINDNKIGCCDTNWKEDIIEELEQLKQDEIDSDSKQKLISKDEMKKVIGRSPDFLDCFIMRMFFIGKTKSSMTIKGLNTKNNNMIWK